MSLHPQPMPDVPEETARIAHAAFPKGNIYIRMRDKVGVFFTDEQFAALFSERGQPAFSPWRLALISIMQFVEDLSDRQAAKTHLQHVLTAAAINFSRLDGWFTGKKRAQTRVSRFATLRPVPA